LPRILSELTVLSYMKAYASITQWSTYVDYRGQYSLQVSILMTFLHVRATHMIQVFIGPIQQSQLMCSYIALSEEIRPVKQEWKWSELLTWTRSTKYYGFLAINIFSKYEVGDKQKNYIDELIKWVSAV
jgi:hypothetical protein